MRHLVLIAFAASLAATGATAADKCRDAKGKFIKCPPPAAAKPAAARCKDAKGKFAKCGAPGAVPA